jgi:RHS repeat-associated protein
MTEAAREYGQDGAHEKLASEFVITMPGYVYIYLSNDNFALNGQQIEVYFDDMHVEHAKSPVISVDDYTPFGVTFNSYKRENSVENRIKFQGQERIIDLDLNWDAFRYRNYMPDIGRFFNIDPLAEKYVYNSPYAFAENKLGRGIELEGLELAGFEVVSAVAEYKARTALSTAKIEDGSGRLISGRSGDVPEQTTPDSGDRETIKIGGKISDGKKVTDGVKEKAKTGVRMGAEGMQTTGDVVETVGVFTAQPEIAATGQAISLTGKGIEMTLDASEGNLQAGDVVYEVTKTAVFNGMGNAAENSVKAGNVDQMANDIFQGFVNGWERLTDWVKEKID